MKPDITEGTSLVGASDVSLRDAFTGLIASLPLLGILLYFFNRVTAPIEARHNADWELDARHSSEPDDQHTEP
jgi:hypothetical protein